WVLYKSKVPEYVAVRDIMIHPVTNDLILATHGRGIFIIDDISPMRQLTSELLQKEVSLLPNRPVAVTSGHYGQAFPSTGSYAGPNPTEQAVVQYYLKDRLKTGEATVEILDPSGQVIATLPGGKRKGINFVPWDMRMAPPKAARGVLVQGEPGVYAGFVGRMVVPGTYKVRVKAGDFTDEGTLTLLPDPLQPDMDYTKRRALSDEIFNMVEDLGLLEAQVRNLKDSTDHRIAATKDKKLIASLTKLSMQLDTFRKTLTETIESKGITGEKQLRARIGALYLFTETSDELPTASVMEGAQTQRGELMQAHTKAETIFKKDLAAVNAALKKAKLPPLAVIDKAEWLHQADKSAPAALPEKPWRLFDLGERD
ncbi:MAG: hypothetical protein ABIO24_09480, partial [Saprospiraceae bacterium]